MNAGKVLRLTLLTLVFLPIKFFETGCVVYQLNEPGGIFQIASIVSSIIK